MRFPARTVALALVALIAASAGMAQQAPPPPSPEGATAPALEDLQKKAEELAQQLKLVQQQLEELRRAQAAAQKQAEAERLRQAAAAAAAQPEPSKEAQPTTSFVSGTRMQPQLNPEISVVGNMYGIGGGGEKNRASVGEWELDVQSYLDPYSRVHVVFSKPEEEGLSVEEGYVTWMNLPGSTTLTLGKTRQQFGVLNRYHPHALDQFDLPLVLQESFGEEGLKGTGVAADWLMPHLWATANELTVSVTNGDNEVAFAGADWKRPAILGRLKNYWDLSESSYLEIGLDALHGSADPEGHLSHDFYAVDATYDWNPARQALYREVTVRAMVLLSRLGLDPGVRRDAWGGFIYGQYKFSPRWTAGVRYDRVEDQREAGHRYWGVSPYLTLAQSEFVRLRGQMNYRNDNLLGVDRTFILQVTVAAGPHKHDTY